jgi:hypothetical protein
MTFELFSIFEQKGDRTFLKRRSLFDIELMTLMKMMIRGFVLCLPFIATVSGFATRPRSLVGNASCSATFGADASNDIIFIDNDKTQGTWLRSSFYENCVAPLSVDKENMLQHIQNLNTIFSQY